MYLVNMMILWRSLGRTGLELDLPENLEQVLEVCDYRLWEKALGTGVDAAWLQRSGSWSKLSSSEHRESTRNKGGVTTLTWNRDSRGYHQLWRVWDFYPSCKLASLACHSFRMWAEDRRLLVRDEWLNLSLSGLTSGLHCYPWILNNDQWS